MKTKKHKTKKHKKYKKHKTWYKGKNKYATCWRTVKRRNFLPRKKRRLAQIRNAPIIIGEGQTTSQPSLISDMLRILFKNKHRSKNLRILDIGSGSGVVTALMACIAGPKSTVLGIDKFKSLVEQSKRNIHKIINRSKLGKITLKPIDVYSFFNTQNKPFDLIYVGAEPKDPHLITQFKHNIPRLLKNKGRAIAPINGKLHIYNKRTFTNQWNPTHIQTRFVPLAPLQTGGSLSLTEKKARIKEEYDSRMSYACKDPQACTTPAITGRTAHLYRKHLFPDFTTKRKLDKWLSSKCIIDVASGLNAFSSTSFIGDLTRRKIGHDVVGIDITQPRKTKKKYRKRARFIKGNASRLPLSSLSLHDKCKKKIVVIHNFFYLWLTNPKKLKKAYKNILSWLTPGSQIRVFPVYFKQYDAFSKDLRKFIQKHFRVKIIKPHIQYESLHEWHPKHKKKIFIKQSDNKSEKTINKELDTHTLILTVK